MILKLGSTGTQVATLQEALGLKGDGSFGPKTDLAVKAYQTKHGLKPDGIVGPKTWDMMGLATTDASEMSSTTAGGLQIIRHYLPKGEYKEGPTKKEYLFLHHTAGWHNPYNTIDEWGRDTRGTIATEFVLGGPSCAGNETKYDGVLLQAIPEGGYGWHLGANGSQYMHEHSVGIEVCNFGQLTEKAGVFYTWSNAKVDPTQVVKFNQKFRGFQYWHRYSDVQLKALKEFILFIANRDNIDVRKGLIAKIRNNGAAKAFEFDQDAYNGKIKGLLTHVNTRTDKFDMFPQDELIDMLLSI